MSGLSINQGVITGNISGFYNEDRSRSTTAVTVGKNGSTRLNFSIAHNVSIYVPETRDYKDEAHFFDLVVWGKMAEFLAKELVIGQQVTVGFSLRQDSWETENGKRSKIQLRVESVVPGRKPNGKQESVGEPVDPNSIPF